MMASKLVSRTTAPPKGAGEIVSTKMDPGLWGSLVGTAAARQPNFTNACDWLPLTRLQSAYSLPDGFADRLWSGCCHGYAGDLRTRIAKSLVHARLRCGVPVRFALRLPASRVAVWDDRGNLGLRSVLALAGQNGVKSPPAPAGTLERPLNHPMCNATSIMFIPSTAPKTIARTKPISLITL